MVSLEFVGQKENLLCSMMDAPKQHPAPAYLLALSLVVVSVALYLPTLGAGFAWDSKIQVQYDTFIHDLQNLPAVLSLRVLGMDVIDSNRPTQLLSLMADAVLWGKQPFGYHLTSVLLHAAVVVLLFSFGHRLNSVWGAFVGALLFAVHPVNCEAVAEVGYREDLLAALFVLAGMNCVAAWGTTWRGGAVCVLSFYFAIGAKEAAVAAPLLLAAYWWWFRRDEPRRPWLILIGAATLVVCLFLLARFVCETNASAVIPKKPVRLGGSWQETLLIQPRIWAFYLRQTVWPQNLCADYGLYSLRNFGLPLALVVLTLVVWGQVFWAGRSRSFALGLAMFWLCLLPVSNLIPLHRPMADRFLYLPLAGAALMVAAMASRFRHIAVILGLLALPLAFITFHQQKIWHDDLSLWRETVQKNPRSFSAFNNLGAALINAGKSQEALRVLEQSVKITGGKNADTWAQMAILLDEQGRPTEADLAFKGAVALDARLARMDLLTSALKWEKRRAEKWKAIAARN